VSIPVERFARVLRVFYGLRVVSSCGFGDLCCWSPGNPDRNLTIHVALREAWNMRELILGPSARYRGRGWRERMAEDCAEWLRRIDDE
jgi:hypothetical protein